VIQGIEDVTDKYERDRLIRKTIRRNSPPKSIEHFNEVSYKSALEWAMGQPNWTEISEAIIKIERSENTNLTAEEKERIMRRYIESKWEEHRMRVKWELDERRGIVAYNSTLENKPVPFYVDRH
jgi:hypothetical protein